MNTSIVNRTQGTLGTLFYLKLRLYEHLPVNCESFVDSAMLTEWFVWALKCTWNGVSSLIIKLHFLRSTICNYTPLCKHGSSFVFRFLSNDLQIQLCP
jgi:hypothetical protein